MSPVIYSNGSRGSGQGRLPAGRLLIALLIVGVSLISYCSTRSTNPITGQAQYVAMSVPQEIALGLQAAPEMAAQHGGLSADAQARARVDAMGRSLLDGLGKETPYQFDFHLLADPQTINAFALPGGQVFITEALYRRLETDGQLAGVLGHEIGHVIQRHAAQQMAKAQLTQGLTGAAVIAAYDPDNPRSRAAPAIAMMIGQLVNLKYGRNDELESDRWGVRLMTSAGYDPHAQMRVMEILRSASEGRGPPEFLSTHPDPGNRIERIREAIDELYPNGLPPNLKP